MRVIVCGLYGYGLYGYMVMHHTKAIGYGFKFFIFGFKVFFSLFIIEILRFNFGG